MSEDHKLIRLLSTLQSMFPNNSRLGGGQDYRVRTEKKQKTPEEKRDEEVEKANKQIYYVLYYEWTKYIKGKRLPKEDRIRHKIKYFLHTLCLDYINSWIIRKDSNEKRLKEIKKGISEKTKEREAVIQKKSIEKQKMNAIEKRYNNKPKRYQEDPEYITAKRNFEIQDDIAKLIVLTPPEQMYEEEYKDCKNTLDTAKASRDKKDKEITEMINNGESPETIKKEREILGYLIEDCHILQKLHDDMLHDQLNKYKDGKLKISVRK